MCGRLAAGLVAWPHKVALFPVLRYVCDLSFSEFERMVGDALDFPIDAVSFLRLRLAPDKTPEPSAAFDILGVHAPATGAHLEFAVSDDKLAIWARALQEALVAGGPLVCGAARVASRIAFGCSSVWRQAPRSRFRALRRLSAGGERGEAVHAGLEWRAAFLVYTQIRNNTGDSVVCSSLGTQRRRLAGSPRRRRRLADRKSQTNVLEIWAVLVAARIWGGRLTVSRVLFLVGHTTALAMPRNGPSAAPDRH